MIGRFERVVVIFGGRDDNFRTFEGGKFEARTYEEMEEIERKFDALDHRSTYWQMFKDKYVKCSCGEEVPCGRFTNTCQCGRDYSFDGSLLADRSLWGEETGEHWTEGY